ncbi:MAG TPA: hypothetical protein VFP63_03795, partial [Dehalococcoidia bacterium]|nr:hypothetical protein [Dehalococcoidia bacterium]
MNIRVSIAAVAAVFASILVQVPGAPPAALAVPANDNLANAHVITTPAVSGIVATGSNVGATTEGSENTNPCVPTGKTVWYTWTSPGTPGTIVFDTWGSDFDTVLATYTGSAFPLSVVGCNDDFSSTNSGLTMAYTADTTYRIQVGGFSSASGNLVLNMALGADIVVDTNADNTTSDFQLSLREAILLARGGTAAGGLGRPLDPAGEIDRVRNAGAAGPASSDLIHFNNGATNIALTSGLPDLNAGLDAVSGVGPGVIIDGQGASISCFSVSGNGNHIEGLQITGCRGSNGAMYITGGGNVVGGAEIPSQRNVIGSGLPSATSSGIHMSGAGATGNSVLGNFIGTNASGTVAQGFSSGIWITLGAHDNTIGGAAPGEGNLISGNNSGVTLGTGAGENNRVLGNKIGTNATGTAAIPNVNVGIYVQGPNTVIGGAGEGEGNIISGNGLGINVGDSPAYMQPIPFAIIQGNKIGTDASGAGALPNSTAGIHIASGYDSALNVIVGGAVQGEGNIIAYNGGAGIFVDSATGNTFQGNSIHSNTGLGVDNSSGGNTEPAPPAIASVTGGTVSGFACSLCTLDVYNDLDDEGRVYLGSATAGAAGDFSLSGISHSLTNITATSTDAAGNTSEFSPPFAAPPNSDGDGLADAADGCPLDPEDYDGFEDGDGCPDTDNDVDGVADTWDYGQTCFDPAGTLSCVTIDCRNMAEDYDAFKDSDGCPEPDNDNDGQADADDDCDGTDLLTGPDGMLGSPQDLNHNGIKDVSEATLTTDDVVKTFEDYDTVLDGDGCHDSPGEDFDGDGFTDDAEALTIGTNAGYPCGNNSWPADLWDQPPLSANKITVQDLTSFIAPVRRLNTSAGNPNFSTRWDLLPGKGIFSNTINVQDMTALVTLAPPMLNGARALNG